MNFTFRIWAIIAYGCMKEGWRSVGDGDWDCEGWERGIPLPWIWETRQDSIIQVRIINQQVIISPFKYLMVVLSISIFNMYLGESQVALSNNGLGKKGKRREIRSNSVGWADKIKIFYMILSTAKALLVFILSDIHWKPRGTNWWFCSQIVFDRIE